ncbi:MAG: protein-L-isoaspartate(D-aspartate) O-methyltransferase [Acetobacterales bacterium]
MRPDSNRIRLVLELRRHGVTDTRVLSVIERTPRHRFVPDAFRDQAYDNLALPIGHGQTISQPVVVALMTEALALQPSMKVLEIGTGSGYQAAILAPLCRRLYTIERHRPLLLEAQKRFSELGLTNIVTLLADGSRGWPEQAPFDRILLTAASGEVPAHMVSQLREGGLLVMPLKETNGAETIVQIRPLGETYGMTRLFPGRFVPLVAGALPDEGM